MKRQAVIQAEIKEPQGKFCKRIYYLAMLVLETIIELILEIIICVLLIIIIS